MMNIQPITAGGQLSLDNQTVFASQGKFMVTEGVFEQFELRADDYQPGSGRLTTFLRNKLANAKLAGVENPIVVGAFPFDQSQKACLRIPLNWQQLSLEQMTAVLQRGTNAQPSVKALTHVPVGNGYKASVNAAKAQFARGEMDKVVLAKCLDIEAFGEISKSAVLAQLVRKNTSGYHFSVPLDNNRVLLGVSPELLLRKVGNGIESNPLAGSRRRTKNQVADKALQLELLGSDKDKIEHSYVTEAIKQQLTPYCSSLMVPNSPALLSTKTMWHLSSHIDGQLKDDKFDAAELACLLHPTPAVGGTPDKQAKDAINTLESFEREFFAGTLGWMNSEGDGEWVVSIRCAMVSQAHARLYAGAGIVADSCPQEELDEVNAKLKTMEEVFGFSYINSANLNPGEAYVS